MRHIIFDDTPHTHEITINEKTPTITFSLRPDLAKFVVELLSGTNRHAEYYEKECGLTSFIPPTQSCWGFGNIFELIETESSWIIWECKLPYKPSWKKLDEISATISDLAMAISMFENEEEPTDTHQFFVIDMMVVKSHDYLNGGSLSFFYSREVLNFAITIWSEREKYDAIMNAMKRFYGHLAGKKDLKLMRDDFYVGQYQGILRCPTFRCPGNCACIAPVHMTRGDAGGAGYVPHNMDSKIQQLTILAGVVKLANMARKGD